MNSAEAIRLALQEFGMAEDELRGRVAIRKTEGFLELRFCGEWMEYTAYIDVADREVVGRLAEPIEELYSRGELIPFLRPDYELAG